MYTYIYVYIYIYYINSIHKIHLHLRCPLIYSPRLSVGFIPMHSSFFVHVTMGYHENITLKRYTSSAKSSFSMDHWSLPKKLWR